MHKLIQEGEVSLLLHAQGGVDGLVAEKVAVEEVQHAGDVGEGDGSEGDVVDGRSGREDGGGLGGLDAEKILKKPYLLGMFLQLRAYISASHTRHCPA